MATSSEKVAAALGGSVMVIAGVIVLVPLATCFGALAGWIVGWFFGDTILHVLGQLGARDVSMWQYGAFLGFTGGFLKTKVTAEVKK